MFQFFEMWGEECTICFHHTECFYINECICKHFICITCIAQLDKCPFCRKCFSSDTLVFTDKYRIPAQSSTNSDQLLFVHSEQYTNFSKNVPYFLYTELRLFDLITNPVIELSNFLHI